MEKSYPTQEERKKFAQQQVKFLKENGVHDPMRVSRIFKAAGPGQIQGAWDLADQAEDSVSKDLLQCVLLSYRTVVKLHRRHIDGSSRLGNKHVEEARQRVSDILSEMDFIPPDATSHFAFFRMLDGAMEILVPNSYPFTKAELKEIEDGLAKRIENKEKNDTEEELADNEPDVDPADFEY